VEAQGCPGTGPPGRPVKAQDNHANPPFRAWPSSAQVQSKAQHGTLGSPGETAVSCRLRAAQKRLRE